jgi:hypothetical protein
MFEKTNRRVLIADFKVGQDQIKIQSVNRLGFNDLHMTRGPNSNSVTIEFSGHQVTLTGVNFNELRPGDFIFNS